MVNAGEHGEWRRMRAAAWLAMCVTAAACGGNHMTEGPDAGVPDDAVPDGPPALPGCREDAPTCGAGGDESCCQAVPVPGGTFFRSYDGVTYTNMGFPATVSNFVLDRYEVTVGRFRAFVNAGMGTQASPPAANAGAHPKLAGSGWDDAWNVQLAASTMELSDAIECSAPYQTWTKEPGTNEDKPINCVTWYEAMAFCIWDGGYLPTETEWNYAASGGSEQRVYPWSSPPGSTSIDCTYANYYVDSPAGTFCVDGVRGGANRVGSEAAKGGGRWGHADLGGNVWEWTLDWHAPYSATCDDCAHLTPKSFRVIRGGSALDNAPSLRTSERGYLTPADRSNTIGFRCARPPS